jgi:hypothetical protein
MHPGVSPARTVNHTFLTGHDGDFFFKLTLHRSGVALTLPTGKIRAVKGKRQLDGA